MSVARVLIIAGSDSGGGAGIQADIKTVTMLGGFAMTAVTAITAQNTLGVDAVMAVPPDMVIAQIDAVVRDLGVDAVKIGMIGSAETAQAVATSLESLAGVPIVFDPVMVASSGAALADAPTIAAFERLMAVASVVTPNAPELAALTGNSVSTEAEMQEAALALAQRSGIAVLAKGGHLGGDMLTDLLAMPDGSVEHWRSDRIATRSTHGTGCTLASAIAAGLGEGSALEQAIGRARQFVRRAILAAPGFGAGHGPMAHWEGYDASSTMNLNQVTVAAIDYDASVAFYRLLGLRQIVDSPPRYARFECPGGSTLSVHVGDSAPSTTVVYFEGADLDLWVAQLKNSGVEFDADPSDQPWLWREARLSDPAGNSICLYHAGDARRFPPWRLGEA